MRASGMQVTNPAGEADTAKGYAGAVTDDLIIGHPFSGNLIKHMLKHEGFDPDSLPFDVMAAGSQWNMSRAQLYGAYQAFYDKDLPKNNQIVKGLKEALPALLAHVEPELIEEEKALLLSDAWAMFIKEKERHWSTAISGENRRSFEILLHVLGEVPVDLVTKQDIRRTLNVIAGLPKRTNAPYKTMSLQECIDFDVPEEDLISSVQVYKHLKIFKSFFKVYLKDLKDILTVSPTEGIKLDVQENRGGNFTYPEMKRMVTHLEGLDDADWRKAYFLKLCYTGARRGEITDLKVGLMRTDEHTGRKYLFIEGGKTDHAQRQIPVHKNIEPLLNKLAEGKKPTAKLFLRLWKNAMPLILTRRSRSAVCMQSDTALSPKH